MSYIGKVYTQDRDENFVEFLKAIGVPDELVQKYVKSKPTSQLVKEGDKYKYISTSTEGSKETIFEPGVEIEDAFLGVPTKTTYTIDGNTVTEVVETSKGCATFKREYDGDNLTVTITSTEWDGVAVRYYKA